ncbi:MAG TPA: c-type cytochrome [Pseudonocardiaceae bacterium]|jgi:ubiquinol-cytochrome c reductase cytochrome c subunit|nr:c-type cytochrome [Pseudonocardiaceae bacterium]
MTTSRSKVRRRLTGLLAIGVSLIGAGALYSVLVPSPQTANASDNTNNSTLINQGQQLYQNSCITCHGANLQGVTDRGPALVGVGSAAVYFQVSTGRMPAQGQSAQEESKPAMFNAAQIDALGAYIESLGGGPTAPDATDTQLASGDPARGGQLFRLNCASCHNFTGQGGDLSGGKFAPSLQDTSANVIYTAMQSGPQNMPKFSDRQLTPTEKQDIISYIKSVQNGNNDPGGNALGGLGPISEGFVAWALGIAALIGVTLWIGAKA